MTMKLPILLLGAGGHARSCIDVIQSNGKYEVYGLIGTSNEIEKKISNYQVLGTEDELPKLMNYCARALVAVGQIKSHILRSALFSTLVEMGYQLPTIISPNAYVSPSSKIGAGSIIMHGAIVNAGAQIGKNCIINSQSLVEHDVTIADHCHVSTGAIINGEVQVGEGCFIGSRSVIKECVVLGNRCIVGMGLSVRHNQQDETSLLKNG